MCDPILLYKTYRTRYKKGYNNFIMIEEEEKQEGEREREEMKYFDYEGLRGEVGFLYRLERLC